MKSEATTSITDAVVRRLEDLVLGELEPGDELPSEADLAATFQVSRLTVREAADDPVALHESDLAFHASLAAGAGNQLLSFLIEAMEEPLRASRMRSMRGHLARGGTVEDVIEQHERILDRVRARDVKGAATAMLAHLEQTARDLRAAFTLTGLEPGAAPAGEPDREATA